MEPKICMCCGEEITELNDGISINNGDFYQCDDCHFIGFGHRILKTLLLFNNNK